MIKRKIRGLKNACLQIRKLNRKANKVQMIIGSFGIKKYYAISGKELQKLFSKIHYPKNNDTFFYYIDEKVSFCLENTIVGNIPVDYSIVLDNSLKDLYKKYNVKVLDLLIEQIRKIAIVNESQKPIIALLAMIDSPCKHFYDALQRILFINQLLWQTGHPLVGLGRLDVLLNQYYEKDMADGEIDKSLAEYYLREFICKLHCYYNYKSNDLPGDTGQIIILGGIDQDGGYFCSELTKTFIRLITELHIPDPKILVRCSDNMPNDLMRLCLECVSTGVGSPLFANDNVIIPGMINNGYSVDDSYGYGTSACWEPLIPGKSTDQNNIFSFRLTETINRYVNHLLENKEECVSYKQFMVGFEKFLCLDLHELSTTKESLCFERDPIQSLFLHDSMENDNDLSEGKVLYNNNGFLTPGFSNGINSLLNIKRLVFENKKYTLRQFNQIRLQGFDEGIIDELRDTGSMYGEDSNETIELTNQVVEMIDRCCLEYKNRYGGKLKFGLSSPSYIMASGESTASFDGRKDGQPFGVHISSQKNIPYTELIGFASQINYRSSNINGNVVDFIVSPDYLKKHGDKFVQFMYSAISKGFFEMQMNVLSSETLKDAKAHPERHMNLIVRVWGFSSYFNDLPEEYKDLLIKRAEINEGICR